MLVGVECGFEEKIKFFLIKLGLDRTSRKPSLPMLLLFSHNLDTNTAMDRVVADSWLEIKFAAAEDGQKQIVTAAQLQEFWDQLLTYGCLVEDKLSIDAALWSCGKCEQEIYFSTLDRVQHIVMTHNNCCTHRCVNQPIFIIINLNLCRLGSS